MTGVTGAAGFIGQFMVPRLLKAIPGSFRILVRSRATQGLLWPNTMQGDLVSARDCEKFAEGLDCIFYFAHHNFPLNSNSDQFADVQANLLPLLQLIHAIRTAGRKPHLIYLSSGGAVYGSGQTRVPFDEEATCRPSNSYGVQKLAAEQYIRIAAEQEILNATVLRVGNAYGTPLPEQRMQGLIGVAASLAMAGKPVTVFGNATNVRDYIHLEDLAEMILRAAKPRTSFNLVNVGSGVGHSVNDVLNLVGEACGRPLEILQASTPEANALPDWVVLDIQKAFREYGWRPTIDLRSGIRILFADAANRQA